MYYNATWQCKQNIRVFQVNHDERKQKIYKIEHMSKSLPQFIQICSLLSDPAHNHNTSKAAQPILRPTIILVYAPETSVGNNLGLGYVALSTMLKEIQVFWNVVLCRLVTPADVSKEFVLSSSESSRHRKVALLRLSTIILENMNGPQNYWT
jgi:hypothetical protein